MKHFIGAPANRRAQMAVVWSVGLPHEAVGELVANERLRAYADRDAGCNSLSRSTISAKGRVTGTGTTRKGKPPPPDHAGMLPVPCTADAAATMHTITSFVGASPTEANRAI